MARSADRKMVAARSAFEFGFLRRRDQDFQQEVGHVRRARSRPTKEDIQTAAGQPRRWHYKMKTGRVLLIFTLATILFACSKQRPFKAHAFRVDSGQGLSGFAELGYSLHNVINASKEQGFEIQHEKDSYGIETIALPYQGLIIYGNSQDNVGAIDCYLKPVWTNFMPFIGTLDSMNIVGSTTIPLNSITETYGNPPIVLLEDSESRKSRGEDYSIRFPDGDTYLWYGKKGFGMRFDSSNTLVRIRIEPPIERKSHE